MKKRSLILTIALVVSLLAGCAGTPVVYYTDCTCPAGSHNAPAAPAATEAPTVAEGAVKTGLYIATGIGDSKSAAAENNGEAKYDFSQPVKSDLTLTAVWDEDVEGAKAALTEEFNALYIPAAYYGEYVQQAEKAFNDGISAINAAQNVDAVIAAFNEASENLAGIRTYFDLIEETVAQYGEENYFAAQWAEIEAIFEDACNYIRSYEGGVPTVEDYIAMAIAKADEVNTKEEDTEIAEGQKLVRIRQLENYAAEVIRNLEDEALIARVNQYLEEGIAAINTATGTTELAEIFAEYMAKIGAIVG